MQFLTATRFFTARARLWLGWLILAAMLALSGCANLPKENGSASLDQLGGSGNQTVDYSILPAINTPEQSARRAAWMNDGNLWHYIAARFTLPIPKDNVRVQEQLAFYSSHIKYLERVTERAQPYLHLIVSRLQENQLPLELALLPIVESAYRPEAVSTSDAAGIWQFLPSTGSHFGLQRTVWYDGRRDIKASTEAAVQYFTRLRVMFNDDWPVIIASYNGGEGTLQRAIAYNQAKGLPTDFWDLTQISQETADYPARLFALVIIFSNPEKFGFTPYPIPNQSVLTEVHISKSVNLGKLAEVTGMSHDELYRLNPGFDKLITGPQTTNLLVPKSLADQFTPSALEAAEKSAMDWGRYTLRRGDNFHKVAYRYGCDVDELLKVNRLSSAYAHPGQTIVVPLGRERAVATARMGDAQMYTVQSGDSMWGLARRFNLDLSELKRINGLGAKAEIKPGQKLVVGFAAAHHKLGAEKKIAEQKREEHPRGTQAVARHEPEKRGEAQAVAAKKRHYTVQHGDTLWNVARRFSTTVQEITAANRLRPNEPLKPGQVLVIASQ
ncbi:LysM peptidoglycan-binding domain-containing protein [Halothiobacillus sp. DCM-1]|uniref:lytic transglycosylase n=1 Tax=Halothiobacillus sp. DCM-1 TaxID=3112558 RepID=UPI0032556338